MRRSLWIVLGVLLTSVLLAVSSFRTAERLRTKGMARPTDDLEWLRMDFNLSDTELTRIRDLHAGYLPQCEDYCRQIATLRKTLAAEMAESTNVTGRAEHLLADMAALRIACQTEMLRHFAEVSRAMPPDQGHRYLAEMRRVTLGQHDTVESSMAGSVDGTHGDH